MNSKKMLTRNDAYDAMYDFLDEYYKKTKAEDITDILSCMLLCSNGTSMDPPVLIDWNRSANKVLTKKQRIFPLNYINSEGKITIDDAYDIMIDYLEEFYKRGHSNEVRALIDSMIILLSGTSTGPAALSNWHKSVDKILQQNPRIRPMSGIW